MANISVIIPCYNVADYIDRCLTTITSQTIGVDALEIICIDDASTDWIAFISSDNWILAIDFDEHLGEPDMQSLVSFIHSHKKEIGIITRKLSMSRCFPLTVSPRFIFL